VPSHCTSLTTVKYVGLLALAKIASTHPDLVVDLQDMIFSCITEEDISVRLRALDLIGGMVSRDTLTDIVKQLMVQLVDTENPLPEYYRIEVIRQTLAMTKRDKYVNIGNNFEWYVAVLVDLARIAKVDVDKELGEELINVCVRVKSVRQFAVTVLLDLLRDFDEGHSEVLAAATWIVGEYSRYSSPCEFVKLVCWSIPRLRWKYCWCRPVINSLSRFNGSMYKRCRRYSLLGRWQ
jgi:AP-3 complex subunit delta